MNTGSIEERLTGGEEKEKEAEERRKSRREKKEGLQSSSLLEPQGKMSPGIHDSCPLSHELSTSATSVEKLESIYVCDRQSERERARASVSCARVHPCGRGPFSPSANLSTSPSHQVRTRP